MCVTGFAGKHTHFFATLLISVTVSLADGDTAMEIIKMTRNIKA